MNSSQILRQQSQNKIRSDHQRINNEHNKKQADAKLTKHIPSTHLSNEGENKDPADCGRKPLLQPGVSRLPVLAKYFHVHTSSEFKQSHIDWEDKPLAGKAKKKKLDRPVPFNRSQHKSAQMAIKNCQPFTTSLSKTHSAQPETSACNGKPNKYWGGCSSTVDSNKGVRKCHEKTTEYASQPSGHCGSFNPLKTSATLNAPLRSNPSKTVQSEGSSAQSVPGVEATLDDMKLLSLKEMSSVDQTGSLGNPSKALNGKGENFQPDHAALLSILKNEGVGFTGQALMTPRSAPYNYLPQRVSVMKSRQKAGPAKGSVSVQFSPDPGALHSVLQNKGVKAGGPVSATVPNSACGPNRDTSIYVPQRVPVKIKKPEATGGPVAFKKTPLQKWTPQRVPNTKHQPMSTLNWRQSSYVTPRQRSFKISLQPHQEVVQRLFDDPEDEQSTAGLDKDPETQMEQFPLQGSSNKPPCEEKTETCRADSDSEGEQTLPALPRESVIFFSVGKKQFRTPRFESQKDSAEQHQLGLVSSHQRNSPAAHNEMSSESEPTQHINPPVLNVKVPDLVTQKTCSLGPAVAMLRKHVSFLAELRLDEEVATYTSVSVPAPSEALVPRPRCGNPLASVLHFEESARFVPIGFDLSSGLSSLHGSPLYER